MTQTDSNPPRRLRLFLRDHRLLDADARVPAGHPLAAYLASRAAYVDLTDIDWIGTGQDAARLALKVDAILWAASRDGELPLTGARSGAGTRRVEVELEGGYLVAAGLELLQDQRLSDFLQAAPTFVPLRDAELRPRGKTLGDVVVNQNAVRVVRELDGVGPAAREPAGD